MILLKRAYSAAEPADGFRVLVDRLWPRGVSRESAALDLWFKQIAPSDQLRQHFHSGELTFDEFAKQYRAELDQNPEAAHLGELLAEHERVTFVYGAKDHEHNHAIVLRDWARQEFAGR